MSTWREYFNRKGEPIDQDAWIREFSDMDSRRVAQDELTHVRVSTVLLGRNHNWGDGPPLIFETMVFPLGDWGDLHCERYTTEAQAVTGHAAILARAKAGEWDEAAGGSE